MLQQTQVKTVIPFWERWLRELPTVAAVAAAPADQIHKLWERLGYYTRVRNLQKAAQVILDQHDGKFPERPEDVLALPGIGRYTAGAICSIAFNQPTPILDGNVIRVLTRLFGIAENPKEKVTNARLWELATALVTQAATERTPELRCGLPKLRAENACSYFNQSLMELGALVCTPRQPQCLLCPVQKQCVAFREGRVDALPNLGKREAATARRFVAFLLERKGKWLVRQRPEGVVNAHLWEFPNVEITAAEVSPAAVFQAEFGREAPELTRVKTLKHSITRYRITVEAYAAQWTSSPGRGAGVWRTPAEMAALAFTAAHKKLASAAAKSILEDR